MSLLNIHQFSQVFLSNSLVGSNVGQWACDFARLWKAQGGNKPLHAAHTAGSAGAHITKLHRTAHNCTIMQWEVICCASSASSLEPVLVPVFTVGFCISNFHRRLRQSDLPDMAKGWTNQLSWRFWLRNGGRKYSFSFGKVMNYFLAGFLGAYLCNIIPLYR